MATPDPHPGHHRQKPNPLTKLALLLASVFGAICLACCIGSWYFARQSRNEVVKDPESVTAVAREIVNIDIPEEYKPSRAQTIHTMFEDIQASVWETENGGIILVAKLTDSFDAFTTDFEACLRRVPLSGMLKRQPHYGGASAASIDIEIHGEKMAFDIFDYSMWGMAGVHETSGVFPTADGRTGLLYIRTETAPETGLEQIENIIHSLR